MEGPRAAAVRKVAVEHRFECSRLEQALLAQAYQKVVPDVRRRIGLRETGTHVSPRSPAARRHTLAKGG
jgi:hypothetical protein